MNIFCYPGIVRRKSVCALLGIDRGLRPLFGVRAGAPLVSGRTDRTEIDMVLGPLLVEAKLTEGGFGNGEAELVCRYAELDEVFDVEELPRSGAVFRSYQLIRGVLAAHHRGKSFLLLYDGRRAPI